MRNLNAAVIQDTLSWQDPKRNRDRFDHHFEALTAAQTPPDLIVLPETFNTAFTMKPWDGAETMDGPTVQWMRESAERTRAVITGSLILKLDDQYRNRMIWAKPNGELDYYDKRHLFRFGGEHHHYTQGNERVVLELEGWRIALFVCYDLRFPVWSRNRQDYDIAIYVANWPYARQFAWDTLIRARAIENQCYVLASNRIGSDPVGNDYHGGSAILDFMGQPLVDFKDRALGQTQALCMKKLREFRQAFPAELDADEFELR